jgi:hypothetical protein
MESIDSYSLNLNSPVGVRKDMIWINLILINKIMIKIKKKKIYMITKTLITNWDKDFSHGRFVCTHETMTCT